MNPNEDIVVTGVGVCCNLGDDLTFIERRLREGNCRRADDSPQFKGYAPAETFNGRCRIIGVYEGDVSDEALGIKKAQSRFMGRASRLALKSARAALAQANLDHRDFAVVFGVGTGDVDAHLDIQKQLADGGMRRVSPTVIPRIMSSTVSANLVNVLETRGPSLTATAACAGGAYNILIAAQMIQSGHADAALAGGTENGDVDFFGGFDSMGAYCRDSNETPERASRPYAADRAGFIFSEGAGSLVLERRGDALARGATILGVIRGWGLSSDGTGSIVAPDWHGARASIASALRHARLRPEDIDYVNTHGTSTPLGDISEVKALRDVFGTRHVRYSSTKGYVGHTITAAGAIEAIFTMAMLRDGWVAPCVNATPLDPALEDYPPVLAPVEAPLRWALSNSFGFGGTNATLVIGRADSAAGQAR